MAEIWLAEQVGPGGFAKELVIKRILPHFAEDKRFTTMFLDEARLAAQLSHPKIAQIYELGELDAQYFIAMEYIQGIDLDVLLQMAVERGEPIPIGYVCKIVMDVLEALDYAHDFTDKSGQPVNLVHRDVSPHNVLISNDGIVKLCDFGVAKAKANQTKTQPGAVKGKFAYMAPEQIQNADDLDRRADVFAAGIMLYELLTGEKPFGDELAAVNAIIALPHPDVRTKRPEVPAALAEIIDRALQKNRDQRYPDAHAMKRDIESFMRTLDEYVGDRELSRYVRTMQGLPMTRHSQPIVSVEGPPDALGEPDPLADTGPQVAPPPTGELRRVTDKEAPVVGPAPSVDGPTEPGITTRTPAPASGSNAPLVIIAVLAIVGIVVALAFLASSLFSTPPPAKPTKPVDVVVKPVDPQKPAANPEILRKPGGSLVMIRSKPDSAEIWVNDTFVGTTPFQALLPVGKYKVEFRAKGKPPKAENIIVDKDTKTFLTEL